MIYYETYATKSKIVSFHVFLDRIWQPAERQTNEGQRRRDIQWKDLYIDE